MQEFSERPLLERAIEGDAESLAKLLEHYVPLLRGRFASDIPARWQSVLTIDDIIQETCTDAFLEVSRFVIRGEGSFGGWLTTIARNNLLNSLEMLEAEKRGGKRKRLDLRSGENSAVNLYDMLAGTATSPSRHAERGEAAGALKQAMAQLPDDHRRVVQMYDLDQRPVQEVAAALDRTPGAVFMLRSRAHRALKKLLGPASDFLTSTGGE